MFSRSWSSCYTESSVGRPSFVTEFGLWDERQAAAAEQIEAQLDDVDLVRVVFCDPHGLARSKTLSAATFLFDTGHAIALNFLGDDPDVGVGEIAGAGDFVVVPDPSTFQLLPQTGSRTAWILGDEFLRDGSPHPLASRRVLRQVVAQFEARDLAPVIGLEIEWYLTRLLAGTPGNAGNGFGRQGAAPQVEAMNGGYQFNLDSYYDSVAEVADPLATMLISLGLPLRSMEHESGPGQLETTFSPMLALDAADAMLLFRTLVKQSCARRGFHASFMALPALDGFDPSGWHLHQSVMNVRTGENLFAVGSTRDALSPEGKAFANGLMDRAAEYCLLSVPTINGYRRLAAQFALSPTLINSSLEDRSAMIRVLGGDGSTHLENRIGEPSANPYLAIASQLSAGLGGLIADQPGTGEKATGGTLPQSLREALKAFGDSSHAQELLGRPLAACLSKLKESEASRFETWSEGQDLADDEVTQWEQREYFGVY
jgi:glutamine synthetase